MKAGRARQQDAAAALAAACDIGAGPCAVSIGGVGAEVDVSPRPIPLAAPLDVTVRFRGGAPSAAEIAITSVTMDMGTTTIPLTSTRPGTLQGRGSLPVCVVGEMTWLAELSLADRPGGVTRLRFDTRTP
ncbi:MAG: hypothetical protein EP329_28385 [Deltaproteobacteria bacterium]|nr:MAG: hypothetical protein EP329_28385 [Deltaproteobacteria bacterium]